MAAVIDRDKGWNRIKRDLKRLDKSYSKVGLPKEAQPKSGHLSSMSDLVIVGAVHEFGAPRVGVPQRSWLRTGADEAKPALNKLIQKQYDAVLRGQTSVHLALRTLGVFMTGRIKRKIRNLKFPPNAPSTIRKKGSANPLIDTGQMVQSITNVEVIKG